MTRAAEAKKEPTVKSDAEISASPDSARVEDSQPTEEKPTALVAADLSSVPAPAWGSRLFLAGLLLSALLHLGALVYVQQNNRDEVGPGGTQLQTVEIDLITVSDWLA